MSRLILSAQNFDIYDGDGQDQVARTGATSIEMLDKAGAIGVILGHSEVGDSSETVCKKLQTLLKRRQTNPSLLTHTTIFVGELWEEFTDNSNEEVAEIVTNQLNYILKDIPLDFLENLVIGYEPKWGSRGSGHDNELPPEPELISTVCRYMRERIKKQYGQELASRLPIIYGGRSTPDRTEQILSDNNLQGLILGSACNTVKKTLDIAQSMQKAMADKKKVLHANFKAYNLTDRYELYISELKKLDDSFTIYISPNQTDIRAVKAVL